MTNESTEPVVPAAKKPLHKRWYVWAIAVFFVIGVLGNLGDDDTTADVDTAPAVAEQPAAVEPAAAPEPEPEPEPEPTAKDVVTSAFGAFDAIEETGKGDGVVKLPGGASAAIVTASHSGGSNFVIQTMDADNETADLLVNDIGKYAGTTFYYGEDLTRLKVGADGSWTIKIAPVADAVAMSADNKGKGDAVLLYDGPAADFVFTHAGSSNFAVKMMGRSEDLLVNEIGKYEGTVPVGPGPAVIIMTADGDWTLKVQ